MLLKSCACNTIEFLSVIDEKLKLVKMSPVFLSRNVKTLILGTLSSIKPLGDTINKILETNLEERKLNEKNATAMSRDVFNFNEAEILNDLVTCKLVDDNKYINKGLVEKKIINS